MIVLCEQNYALFTGRSGTAQLCRQMLGCATFSGKNNVWEIYFPQSPFTFHGEKGFVCQQCTVAFLTQTAYA